METVITQREILEDSGAVLLRLAPQISYAHLSAFKKVIQDEYAEGRVRVVLCLKDLEILYSIFVGALRSLQKEARDKGGDLKLCEAGSHVQEVFRNLGMQSIMPLYANVAEASKSF